MPLGAAQKGLTVEQAYLEEGHGKHEINTEPELEALHGWAEEQHKATQYGDYAKDIRSGGWPSTSPVYRVPCVRYGMLRGEQHPDGGRRGDPSRPRADLDSDRAVLGGREEPGGPVSAR